MLLDTHILIWFIEDDKLLPQKIKKLIENTDNNCFLSCVSLYEIVIKINIGKLSIGKSINTLFQQIIDANIIMLNISQNDLANYLTMPNYPQHKDPFDRLIIATTIANNYSLISNDKNFELYKNKLKLIS